MANTKNITKLVEMINKVAPGNKDMDDDLMLLYHGMLHDVPDEILSDAAMLHISKPDTAWLPSPGELRHLCKQVTRMTPSTYCDASLELRNSLENSEGYYWKKLVEYDKHVSECSICTEPKNDQLPRIPQSISEIAKQIEH